MIRLVVAAALLCGLALCFNEDYVVMYQRTPLQIPSKYRMVEISGTEEEWLNTPVTFTIALKQRNLDILEKLFWRISDPTDSMYGKHMTLDQINELTAPHEDVRDAVFAWVKAVDETTNNKIPLHIVDRKYALKITSSVEFAQKLFRTQIFPFRRDGSGSREFIKYMGTLSVPKRLRQSLDIVTGIVQFMPIPQGLRLSSSSEIAGTGGCNVPYTMKRMYSVDQTLTASNQKASQAPYSEQGRKKEGFGKDDLQTYQQINGVVVKPITNLIGDDVVNYVDTDTDTEAALDVQMLTGFGNGANTSFWVMEDWMYEFASQILHTNQPPLVNSMSYGWYESEQCVVDGNCTAEGFSSSESYVQATDVEFQKLGVMGITMLAASGDDGTETDRQCDEMRPDYPAASVYVTSVGATAVVASTSGTPLGSDAPPVCTKSTYNCACSTSNTENAAMRTNSAGFDSGGGFSNYLPRPSYQSSAVSQYLNSGVNLPPQKYWNSTNRAYPDVSAVGADVLIVKTGSTIKVGGTSASTPIWGGLITLLNNDRLNSGKAPLGFINPLLYQMWANQPNTFTDITVGSNGGGCSNLAFIATKGWDPVTGLGTPVFDKIRAYVANLP